MLIIIFLYYIFGTIHTGSCDRYNYDSFSLKNGLTVLTATHHSVNKSFCAISIKNSVFKEPIPGLLHLIEHVLHKGIETRLENDDLRKLMSQHNGISNGCTEDDMISFYFEVNSAVFEDALESFSKFFLQPTFHGNEIEHEIQCINNEFLRQKYVDNSRILRICDITKNYPYNKFNFGNKNSLNDKDIKKTILKYWSKNFYASDMKLVIYHNKNIKSKIIDLFKNAKVGNNIEYEKSEGRDCLKNFNPKVFSPQFMKRIIHVESFKDQFELRIQVEIPNIHEVYINNSYNFIKFVLERKGYDSSIYNLKKRMLAYEITVNVEKILEFSICILIFKLTKKGYENIKIALNIIHNCLYVVKFEKDKYEALKNIEQERFNYIINNPSSSNVIKIANDLQYYPIEHFLNHEYIFSFFDEYELTCLLDIIRNKENWIILVISKDQNKIKIEQKFEDVYEIKYFIDGELEFNNIFYEINLFEDNETKFDINLILNKGAQIFTCKDHNNFENDMQWNKNNGVYQYKKRSGIITYVSGKNLDMSYSCVSILLNTQFTNITALQNIIFFRMLEDYYNELHQDVLFFNIIKFTWKIKDFGIELTWQGLSEKIHESIDIYFLAFEKMNFSRVDFIKEILKIELNQYENLPPLRLIYKSLFKLFIKDYIDINDYIDLIDDIKINDIEKKCSYHVEMVILSDHEMCCFKTIFDNVCNLFEPKDQYRSITKISKPKITLATNDPENNALLILFKFCSINDYEKLAGIKIYISFIHALFFREFRTKKELGYDVKCDVILINEYCYLTFSLTSPFDIEVLEKEFLNFFSNLDVLITNIDDIEFEKYKEVAINKFKKNTVNINENFMFFKELYYANHLDIFYANNLIECIGKFNKKDFVLPNERTIVCAKNKNY